MCRWPGWRSLRRRPHGRDSGSTTDSGGSTDSSSATNSNFIDAGPGKWVKLTSLHAKVDHVAIQHTVSSDMGTAVAHGKFVIVTLSVTNHSDTPQRFDGMGDETVLILANNKNYSEDFHAGNGIDQSSFIWDFDDIQPDTTVSHDVIFDVPKHATVSFANLAVANFGSDFSSISSGDEVGRIDLGSLA